MLIDEFISLLEKPRKIESGWSARCPAHDDRHSSLSVAVTHEGKILIKCHAGCDREDILKVLGLNWKDMFEESLPSVNGGITVGELAFDKGFLEDFLLELGVEQKGSWVRIGYFLEDGTPASRQRKRIALSAKEGSFWDKGSGKPVPYGLWKLAEAKETGILFLVEGESDCWTLWFYGYAVLGIPGADMGQKLQAAHLDGVNNIYIIKETDQGGETFVKGMRNRLRELHFRGSTFVIEMNGCKDPNQLHQRSPNFQQDFTALIENANPLSLVEPEMDVTVNYGELIPSLPEPVDKSVLELMGQAVASGDNFAVIAPQGAGKSYANAHIAVQVLKKGRSVILVSRSHDELNQLGKTIKELLIAAGLPEYHLFHLKGANREEEDNRHPNKIPDVRPIIVIAPHVYFQFKGETPYHHTLADMIFQKEFGDNPLVLVDEFVSFLETCFLSKALGSRKSLKPVFGEELWIRNKLCPLFTKSGNCLNCTGHMFLQPRRGQGGMLYHQPIYQHHKEDQLKKEKVELAGFVQWDMWFPDNTMRVYLLNQPKGFAQRKWSTGRKDDLQLDVTLKFWLKDILTRMIEPSLVYFYPYDTESKENIGRPLNEEELEEKKKGRRIVPPRHVCGVPILQGWDLAVLRKVNESAQVGLTGPSASEADRFVLKQALDLSEDHYKVAKTPYVRFQNLLIISIDKDLPFRDKETQALITTWTQATKVLSFLPTYYDAANAEKEISEKVKTMFYDGAQKIRNAPIEGTSIEFDICISCIHGPLGQGLDLGQFKIALVSTNCERPKCLFVGRPINKTNKEYIVEDVAEKSRQAALRILRLTENENADAPRIVVFYGRYSYEVGQRVQQELAKVGHTVNVINAQKCLRYTQELSMKWLSNQDIADLDLIGAQKYEEQEILDSAKATILGYLQKHHEAGWRKIIGNIREIKDLPRHHKDKVKEWFQERSQKAKSDGKMQKLLDRIKKHLAEHPDAEWPEIRRKFNLSRKTEEEKESIRKIIGL